MHDTPPLALIQLDPWLAPYEEQLRHRQERTHAVQQQLSEYFGSWEKATSGHLTLGLIRQPDASWHFREWAPEAKAVSLIGDFNDWNPSAHRLQRDSQGFWEISLPADLIHHGDFYKIHIHGADDSRRDRLPAYLNFCHQDSVSYDYCGQVWAPDAPYVWQFPFQRELTSAPLIYEAHVGLAGEEPRVHTYREFADFVLPRIAKLGYNTIQLMAVQEHPYYGSFGYHVSSLFAASCRFGTPDDLKYLIDQAHRYDIAVLLDVVHSHAIKNIAEGLGFFDGTDHQYFLSGERGMHPQWDSRLFNYARLEVLQFLLSNLRFWLEEFHFDGFRFDGVTSMLYHHHGLHSFDHYDRYFDHEVCEEAVTYLQLATQLIHSIRPDALIVAEDMSGMPGLCRPFSEGGLGCTHRLAMGIPDFWIRLLKHQRDEDWSIEEIWHTLSNRRHGEATIAYAESHDQCLVGDKTLAFWLMDQEMYWHMRLQDQSPIIDRGIALHKILRLLTLSLGGEGYLNFIGNEFGHPEWLDFPREGNNWSFQHCRRQWSLVDSPDLRYQHLAAFDQAMIQLAKKHGLLHSPPAQLLHLDPKNQVLIATRGSLLFLFNLSPHHSIPHYQFPAGPCSGDYQVVLHADDPAFGGHNRLDPSVIYPVHFAADGSPQFSIYLPNRCAIVLQNLTTPASSIS